MWELWTNLSIELDESGDFILRGMKDELKYFCFINNNDTITVFRDVTMIGTMNLTHFVTLFG